MVDVEMENNYNFFNRNFPSIQKVSTSSDECKKSYSRWSQAHTSDFFSAATNLIMEMYSRGVMAFKLKTREAEVLFSCKYWRGDCYARKKDDFSGCV